jgi:glutamate carboxypeptidase
LPIDDCGWGKSKVETRLHWAAAAFSEFRTSSFEFRISAIENRQRGLHCRLMIADCRLKTRCGELLRCQSAIGNRKSAIFLAGGGTMDVKSLLEACRSELRPMLQCLRQTVEMESPSSSKPGVDRLARFIAEKCRQRAGKTHVLQHPMAGCAVLAEFWAGRRDQKPILLLGHLDTVWEIGTLAQMPFSVRGEQAFGPGILDMKAGIVIGLWAIRALQALKISPKGPIHFFLNSDEEVSSVAFRKEILAEARGARAVLVLEPAAAGGALKTARKGVGEFKITVHGRSAHAGVNPAAGVNAITELTRQLWRVEAMARLRQGLTFNVGRIEGGTRSNVVPELATAWIDVRIPRLRDRTAIEHKVRRLKPYHQEARLEIEGGINRPPMERKMAAALFRKACALGRAMGMDLTEASTGGGSDGNFTAALGVPTLDGLGAVGDGAHARDEHILIPELPRRAALLAGLLATL